MPYSDAKRLKEIQCVAKAADSEDTPTVSELPCPTALGATRPSLVEDRASCFCVGTCIQRGHSSSRLHRRLPFTGGSKCPTPTRWTLSHNRQCALTSGTLNLNGDFHASVKSTVEGESTDKPTTSVVGH